MYFSLISALLSAAVALASPVELNTVSARDSPDPMFGLVALALHNDNRAQYGADALSWNDEIYDDTLSWASQCRNEPSGGTEYGENLYVGGSDEDGISAAMDAWMAEADTYDYINPETAENAESSKHFSQVVWKSTTAVACAVANCEAGGVAVEASTFTVCRYTPAGNVAGQFADNVGQKVAESASE